MVKSDRTIILFSLSYPYGHIEHSFLRDELTYLNVAFKKVVIVPEKIENKLIAIPEGIIVENSLATDLKKISLRIKFKAVLSVQFFKEIFKIKFNKKKIRYALAARISALVTHKWLQDYIDGVETKKLVLYSFWFDFTTLGAVMFKENNELTMVVSRCHNFDLYGNEFNGFYVPYQKNVLNKLDMVYPDSFYGRDYILKLFPKVNCKAGIMGVSEPTNLNTKSSSSEIHIVSCAYMIPRKRIGLLLDALIYLEEKRPDLFIHWTHIGEGPEWDMLVEKKKKFQGNVKVTFKGNIDNDELIDFYNSNSVDLFVNTSTKEGTPVSIIEAISYGIPILATGFGGGKEIVEKGAGILLSPNPNAVEIGQKIEYLIDENLLEPMRIKSKNVWKNHYNSANNYKSFCNDLVNL